MKTFDVIVIGAGPGGCSAAITLRHRGHSVALINAPFLHEKPTETASPMLKKTLQSIGAEEALGACEPCFGIESNWGRPRPELQPSILNPYGHAWFVHRSRFDQLLRKVAQERGAESIDVRARDVVFGDDAVEIRFDGRDSVRARRVVFATGSLSWTARQTNQQPVMTDSLIAIWTHLPYEITERILSVEATEYGWWYRCPSEKKGAFVCLVTNSENLRELNAARPEEWTKLFSATKLSVPTDAQGWTGNLRVIQTGLGLLPRRHGEEWIAIGDSAVRLDPLGSSGMIHALESGRRVGNAITADSKKHDVAMAEYEEWASKLYSEFNRQRLQQYSKEAGVREARFWNSYLNK